MTINAARLTGGEAWRKPKRCKLHTCRVWFTPVVEWNKFHSPACKRAWHEAQRRTAMALLRKGRR